MIKSMTGYGIANLESDTHTINVEVKTLNSKFFDLSIKVPKLFSEKELEIRNLINDKLERGKVAVSIEYLKKGQVSSRININRDLFKSYYAELSDLVQEVDAPQNDLFKIVLQLPEVQVLQKDNEDIENDWSLVKGVLQEAVKKCNEFREIEGRALLSKFFEYISAIEKNLSDIEAQAPLRLENIKARVRSNIEELIPQEQVDKNRFEQELIYYIEKLDINEETVRLKAHLKFFLEVINNESSPGKKLNFIAQEIGREINTIGSKANDSNIQKSVVYMKEELEKIKEQLLNIL